MHFERPITKKMKAQQEAERQARLNAEYQAALERQRAEQQARLEKARIEWEALLKTLPKELDRLEKLVAKDVLEWEEKANSQINWDQIEDPACSTEWKLRFNSYERVEDIVSHYYESSDGRREGYTTDRVIREKMPGSYWVNPKYPHKEFFVSRATTPDGPVPPIKYPHCTISGGEEPSWDRFAYPNDKARIDALVQKKEQDREYYKARIQEAEAALKGTTQERAKYLLSQREGDQIRNALKKVWRTLNPDKTETKFWEDVLQTL